MFTYMFNSVLTKVSSHTFSMTTATTTTTDFCLITADLVNNKQIVFWELQLQDQSYGSCIHEPLTGSTGFIHLSPY